MDVQVVLYGVVGDVYAIRCYEILEGVVVRVADCHLPRVYVLNAHLSGVYIDLPGVYLWPSVVVEYIRYARVWRGRGRYLMEVLH